MRLLSQFFDVEGIYQPVHRDQHIGLLALTVNALCYGNHTDASEGELVKELHRIGQAARHAAGVIDKNDIEATM